MRESLQTSPGCPGVAQLRALADGRAGEETRQTLVAHLAECDDCLTQYLAFLEEEPLLAPAGAPAAKAQAHIGRRAGRRKKFSMFAIIAAAACLAMTLWGCLSAANAQRQKADLAAQPQPGLVQQLDEAANGLSDTLDGFFASLNEKVVKK